MSFAYQAPLEKMLAVLGAFAATGHNQDDLGEIAPAVLQEAARFCEQELAAVNASGDNEGSQLVDGRVRTPRGFERVYRAYTEAGWPALDLPESVGGQALPLPLQVAFAEMVNSANVSFGMLAIQTRAAAWLALEHGDAEFVQSVVPKLCTGEWTATIGITEPQAGSDVARIRSLATPNDDGSYRLSGTKMFISYADHDLTERIIHFLLARTPDAPPGTRGISLFAVPSVRLDDGTPNAVSVSRVEKKMGLKASPTCVLELDQAHAIRIGPEQRGLVSMFAMVRLMRLEVGIQGVGLAEASAQCAWRYAAERCQGGDPNAPPVAIIQHADVQRMLLDSQCRIDAMRALLIETANLLHCERTNQDKSVAAMAAAQANLLLPVCKACASDLAFYVANNTVQVYGGHGYITELGVEQYVRDSRVMSIYEGTNGIQAIDLLFRKIFKDQGDALSRLLNRIENDAEDQSRSQRTSAVCRGVQIIRQLSAELQAATSNNTTQAYAVATDFLRLTGVVCGAWMWLRMPSVRGQHGADSERLAEFYFQYVFPEVELYENRIRSAGALAACMKTN